MEHTVELLPGGTRVWINKEHRFGTDALLLLSFCKVLPRWAACDLGAGCGILLLGLVDKGLRGPAAGVELAPEGTSLLAGAAAENELSNVEAVNCDLRAYRPGRQYDIVVANPPYFAAGPLPPGQQRASARHEHTATLEDFCRCASRILKDRGRFCLCFPSARLAELMSALREHKLEPKKMQLVRKSVVEEPWLVLVEAHKAGGVGLKVQPDYILPPGQPILY